MKMLKNAIILMIFMMLFVVSKQSIAQNQHNVVTHIVIGVNGQPSIQRSYWQESDRFEPLLVGDFVSNNDRIFISEGSGDEVYINCENGEIIPVTSSSSPKCEFIVPPLIILPNADDNDLRAAGDGGKDMTIIQPIGKILPQSLVYRWLPQTEATSYELTITDGQFNEVATTELPRASTTVEFEVDTSAYLPGEYYFQVRALDEDGDVVMSSTERIEESRQFEVVSEDIIVDVNNEISLRNDNVYMEDMQSFVAAIIYANNDLYTDAIVSMMSALDIRITGNGKFVGSQPQINSVTSGTTPYMLLGSWFNELGLYDLERESYQRALELATAYNRVEEINLAKVVLARFDRCNRDVMLSEAEDYFAKYELFAPITNIITELMDDDSEAIDDCS